MSLQTCPDLTEAVPLEPSLGLYLKPVSRIKMNVQLPRVQAPGQSISSWHVMERIKEAVRPDAFLSLKALKIAARAIHFEGELEAKAACDRALARLKAAHSLDVSGFCERLPIRAAHSALPGPTRHDWEAFFRDAKGVNEMRPGERPDTVHLLELPTRWFRGDKSGEAGGGRPSEKLLRKAFGTFGKIRRLEAIRAAPGDGTFGSLQGESTFEAYVQYEEYVEFSIAMDTLRGKKLLYKEPDGKAHSADIQVDFDRTNYLSDKCIKLRETEAKKLQRAPSPDRLKSSKENGDKSSKSAGVEKEVSSVTQESQGDREKTGERKTLHKKEKEELEKSQTEAKLLLKELLRRAEKHKRKTEAESEKPPELKELKKCDTSAAKRVPPQERVESLTPDRRACKEEHKKKKKRKRAEKEGSNRSLLLEEEEEEGRRRKLIAQERLLKEKLLRNLKLREEEKMRERERLRRELAGQKGLLKSVLVGGRHKKR